MAGIRFRAKYPMDKTDLYCGSRPFRGQQTTVFKAGQLYETSYSGWKDDSCVSSYVATWQERSRNGKCWKLSLHAEGIQGPLNQRSDFTEAKQPCQRLYDEHTAITGDGNPPAQQVGQRLGQQFEGLEEYDYRLEPRTGRRFYPSSRTTHSSSSSHWQRSSGSKSNRSWGSWQTSSWTEQ